VEGSRPSAHQEPNFVFEQVAALQCKNISGFRHAYPNINNLLNLSAYGASFHMIKVLIE
jgi:hypothetical protein